MVEAHFKECLAVLILAVAFSLAACSVDIKDKVESTTDNSDDMVNLEESARALGLRGPRPLAGEHYQIHVGPSANDYSLELHLPPLEGPLRRRNLSTGAEGVIPSREGPFLDPGAEPGQSYEYEAAGSGGRRIQFRVEMPIDWKIEAVTMIPFENGLMERSPRRLFFGPDGVLVTNGARLQLRIEELLAEKGSRLVTFLKNQRAPADQPGRHGGELRLSALRATGELKIELRGEAGGHGSDGPPYGDRPIQVDKFRPAPGGAPGHPGKNGQRGGDSGAAQITLVRGEGFSFSVEQEGGEGGQGGRGGPGQLGAKGNEVWPDGPQGPPGADGQPGDSGQITGRVCFRSPREYRCGEATSPP